MLQDRILTLEVINLALTVKDFLKQGYLIGKEIKALQYVKQRAYEQATSCGFRLSDTYSSGGGKKTGRLDNYISFSFDLDQRINDLYSTQKDTLRVINTVTDTTLRTLLIYRYMNLWEWDRIAKEMGYSTNHVKGQLHARALESVKFIKDNTP